MEIKVYRTDQLTDYHHCKSGTSISPTAKEVLNTVRVLRSNGENSVKCRWLHTKSPRLTTACYNCGQSDHPKYVRWLLKRPPPQLKIPVPWPVAIQPTQLDDDKTRSIYNHFTSDCSLLNQTGLLIAHPVTVATPICMKNLVINTHLKSLSGKIQLKKKTHEKIMYFMI